MFWATTTRARSRAKVIGAALILGLLAPLAVIATGAGSQSAEAVTYNAASVSLKFKLASRVVIVGTGKSVGDIQKYTNVATIDGVIIDAVVRTVAIAGATVSKFDEGSAVTAAPPGSTQSVDDLFQSNISGTSGTESMITYEFSFYEGGTYTGTGSGVPVTLTNVAINSYDIDGSQGVKQFTDFRGFQSYTTYTESSTKGLDVLDKGAGLVRFQIKDGSVGATDTTGSYSFSRVKVNYDQISTLTVRIGELGTGTAYYALDFSAGGMWTTNGTDPVIPTTSTNGFNTAPTTSDITTFYAAQNTGYVFRAADFPYSDIDDNAFTAAKIVALPGVGEGALEYYDGAAWAPVVAGQVFSTGDLDLGVLRLIPTAAGGSFSFQVNDGLVYSTSATLTFTAPANSQAITFPDPGAQGPTTHAFASGATADSGLTPTLTSQSTGVCTVSGLTITTLTLPGGVTSATCVIVATQEGDATYGRAQAVIRQFVVTSLLAQTITFVNPGDSAFSSSAIASGATTNAPARTVTIASLTPTVCTVSGLNILPVKPGLCSIRATQAGDSTYAAASPVTQSFTILKAVQAITFAQPATSTFAIGSLTVGPTTDATGLTPALASITPGVCTVSGFTVTYVAAGTCSLTASQAGNATYAAATDVTRSFGILAISTTTLDDGQVGTAHTQTLTVDGAASGGAWSTPDTLPDGVTLDATTGALGGTPTAAFSGSITLRYTEGGAAASVTLPLTVVGAAAKTPQVITLAQPRAQLFATGSITVAPTTDAAGLTVALVSNTAAVCTVSGYTITFVTTGYCEVTASQAGDSTYDAATDETTSFQIFRIVTTSVPAGEVGTYYSQFVVIEGGTNSGYWSDGNALPAGLNMDPYIGEIFGTPTAPFDGIVTIDYSEAGVHAYVDLHVVIAAQPVAQTITFAPITTKALASATLVLAPTTDAAGLTPSLITSAASICTVSGFTVTFVSAGLCSVTASQAGDADYLAAADVSRTFRIIAVTTPSLASGRIGDSYTNGQTLAGAAGGGAFHTSSALAGLSLDASTGVISGTPTASGTFPVVVDYLEDGATASKSLVLVIVPASVAAAAPTPGPTAPAPITRNAPVRDAPAAAAPKPTPTATATAAGSAAKPAAKQNTVDLGGDPNSALAGKTLGSLSADERDQVRRSPDEAQSQALAGYEQFAGVQVDVIGAKTVATLAIAANQSIDATAIAQAIRNAAGDEKGSFVKLSDVASTGRPAIVPSLTIPKDDAAYFTLSRLDEPTALSDIDTTNSKSWVHFAVDVTGYKPGTTAYLTMTSSPVVFASALVGKDGTAHIEGDMALDVLPAGVHRLRVVGDRAIGMVTADAAGAVLLTAAQMTEIQKFDQGTDAAVRLSGANGSGGEHLAVRIIPLDQQVPWWLLWMLGALVLLLISARLSRVAEGAAGRWIKRSVFLIAGLVPVGVGLVIEVPLLSAIAGGIVLVGLVLTFVLPVVRESYDEEYQYEPAYRPAW